jgi:glycosyltransferase involved in cell wall biosynthesis
MNMVNKYLFNFSASYSGGGLKRLYEYAKWFDGNGGAWFVIHENCRHLRPQFSRNRFFVVKQSNLGRLLNDCAYLKQITAEIGVPQLYYSYGIPIYSRTGAVNWFHLSNVLPLHHRNIPLPLILLLTQKYLGTRIEGNLEHADIISAESSYSLGFIDAKRHKTLVVSVNGSDDELMQIKAGGAPHTQSIAVVVGTNSHKALDDSMAVFEALRSSDPALKLHVIGDEKYIPRALLRAFLSNPQIIIRGILPRPDVVSCLRQAKYYLSTTLIENSYNAASEGIFLAEESYISDIGPHRELLANERFDEVPVPGLRRRMLHVTRSGLKGVNLKTWDTVIMEMLNRFAVELRSR